MKRGTKLVITGIAFLASLAATIYTNKMVVQAESELRQYPAYNRAIQLDEINAKLRSTKLDLVYKPSEVDIASYGGFGASINFAEYPAPKDAKAMINDVLTSADNLGTIEDQLKQIHDELPDENRIKMHNGKKVDNRTFNKQRIALDNIIREISNRKDSYMNKIPHSLKSAPSRYAFGFAASIYACIGSFLYGMYNFLKREQ